MANVPAGHALVEVQHDRRSRRMDLTDPANPQVVDYGPPASSTDHEWNATTNRWLLKSEVQANQAARAAALAEIAAIEAGQPREMRETLLDPANVEARTRVQVSDMRIAALRTTADRRQ